MYTKTSFIRWIHYNICKSHYMYIPARTPNHATWPSTRRAQGNWLVILKSISFFFSKSSAGCSDQGAGQRPCRSVSGDQKKSKG